MKLSVSLKKKRICPRWRLKTLKGRIQIWIRFFWVNISIDCKEGFSKKLILDNYTNYRFNTGMSELVPNWVRFSRNGTNLVLFKLILFSTYWLTEQKCTWGQSDGHGLKILIRMNDKVKIWILHKAYCIICIIL